MEELCKLIHDALYPSHEFTGKARLFCAHFLENLYALGNFLEVISQHFLNDFFISIKVSSASTLYIVVNLLLGNLTLEVVHQLLRDAFIGFEIKNPMESFMPKRLRQVHVATDIEYRGSVRCMETMQVRIGANPHDRRAHLFAKL